MSWKQRKRGDFLGRIRQGSEEQHPGPYSKEPSQMSEEELDQEVARLEREVRESKERSVSLGREYLAQASSGSALFPRRRRRPYWK